MGSTTPHLFAIVSHPTCMVSWPFFQRLPEGRCLSGKGCPCYKGFQKSAAPPAKAKIVRLVGKFEISKGCRHAWHHHSDRSYLVATTQGWPLTNLQTWCLILFDKLTQQQLLQYYNILTIPTIPFLGWGSYLRWQWPWQAEWQQQLFCLAENVKALQVGKTLPK